MIFLSVELLLRWATLAALVYAVVVWLTHWAVRSRRIQPFGGWARFVRRISDPVLTPIERRIIRFGGSPQDAPLWLVGLVVVLGLLSISLVRWLAGWWYRLAALRGAGPAVWLAAVVTSLLNLVWIAILVRVLGSWFGAGRYNRWMRPAYLLTDWIVEPIRRVLPPLGAIDLSPLVALLVVDWVLRPILMRLILAVAG